MIASLKDKRGIAEEELEKGERESQFEQLIIKEMLDERDRGLPPIPEEIASSMNSSFFFDNAIVHESGVRPVFTPSSSVVFDERDQPPPFFISQSPIFDPNRAHLPPLVSGGIIDVKPVMQQGTTEQSDQEKEAKEEKEKKGERRDEAYSMTESADIEREWRRLKEEEKRLQLILDMKETQHFEGLMREGHIDETHSPEEIRKKVEQRKEREKGRSKYLAVEAVLLVVSLQLFVSLYLRQEYMEMRSNLPIRSDTCPVDGERRIIWEKEVVLEEEKMGRQIEEGVNEREEGEREEMQEELQFKSGAKEEEEDDEKHEDVEELRAEEQEEEDEYEAEDSQEEELEQEEQSHAEELEMKPRVGEERETGYREERREIRECGGAWVENFGESEGVVEIPRACFTQVAAELII